MTMLDFIGSAVGTRFVAGGRDHGGWDCWGCVCVGHRDVLGVALSPYGDVATGDRAAVARRMRDGTSGAEPFVQVTDPREMDVVVMRLPGGRRFGHVGLYDGHGHVLHVEQGSHTMLERIDSVTISGRVMGFWRHVA